MWIPLLLSFLLGSQVGALPLNARAVTYATIANGTVWGGQYGYVEYFNQIPYAQPPIGDLRLRPPRSLNTTFGNGMIDGTTLFPKSCPQFYLQTDNLNDLPATTLAIIFNSPYYQAAFNVGEDCLHVNIVRPTGSYAGAKLPVAVWIYGGGFEQGSTLLYNAAHLVQKSVLIGSPMIFVAVNYRVGGFGFMAGKELAAEKSTNLGLRDQRLALQWVQENIEGFGGDPSKVTIWGESAGAVSVFDHTIVNGGDHLYKGKPLFRGAIMNSGSVVPADSVTSTQAQTIYNQVVAAAGCAGQPDTLACLRKADYTILLNAMNSVPALIGYRALDLSYLPRPDPSDKFFPISPELAIQRGRYAKVPIIIGDQEDEGTLFALFQSNLTTTDQLIDYIASCFPALKDAKRIVTGLVNTYPEDLGYSGSPFNTALQNNFYPQFKRLAAILGDVSMTLARRVYLSRVAASQPCWSYLSSYLYGTPYLGTYHASDIQYMFGYLGDNLPTTTIQKYLISFISLADPNGLGTVQPTPYWPQWKHDSPLLLSLKSQYAEVIPDDFRKAAYEYIKSMTSKFRV